MLKFKVAFFLLLALFTVQGGSACAAMTLSSQDIKEGQLLTLRQVFNDFGCEGENISPQLSWENVPEKAKSLAVTVYDPDAPTGSGWWHWVVYNIPAQTKELKAGASLTSLPQGSTEGVTDYGKPGFGGACPPKGDKPHHYVVTLFALDVLRLDLPANATAAMVGYNLNAHTIEKAKLTAVYSRP